MNTLENDPHTNNATPQGKVTGLSTANVRAQAAAGHINRMPKSGDGGVAAIVRRNLFTLFNLLNLVLAALLVLVGSYRNLLFMGVVVSNAVIGLVQELRAKRTHDRLLLLSEGRRARHSRRGGDRRASGRAGAGRRGAHPARRSGARRRKGAPWQRGSERIAIDGRKRRDPQGGRRYAIIGQLCDRGRVDRRADRRGRTELRGQAANQRAQAQAPLQRADGLAQPDHPRRQPDAGAHRRGTLFPPDARAGYGYPRRRDQNRRRHAGHDPGRAHIAHIGGAGGGRGAAGSAARAGQRALRHRKPRPCGCAVSG